MDPDDEKLLSDVAAFSTVVAGDVLINNINASSAGVVASFDSTTQRVVIEASESASVLELDSNGTNLFSALLIPEGRVDPEVASNGISRARSYRIADAAEQAFEELSGLFRDESFVGGAALGRSGTFISTVV